MSKKKGTDAKQDQPTYSSMLALILENPDNRTVEQAEVTRWLATHLRVQGNINNDYLWYDYRDKHLPLGINHFLSNPPEPTLIIFGRLFHDKSWNTIYQGAIPETIAAFVALWKEKGGSL